MEIPIIVSPQVGKNGLPVLISVKQAAVVLYKKTFISFICCGNGVLAVNL
jgi:hypothetical protein